MHFRVGKSLQITAPGKQDEKEHQNSDGDGDQKCHEDVDPKGQIFPSAFGDAQDEKADRYFDETCLDRKLSVCHKHPLEKSVDLGGWQGLYVPSTPVHRLKIDEDGTKGSDYLTCKSQPLLQSCLRCGSQLSYQSSCYYVIV